VITVTPQIRLSSRARRRGPALLTHVRRNRLARRPGTPVAISCWGHPDSATVTAFGRNPLLLATLAQARLAGLEIQLNRLFRSCV
jgi:hypothetical protein